MRWVVSIGAALLLAALLPGCSGGGGESSSEGGDELVVGTLSDAIALDGALVSDQVSLRAVAQIFEGLTSLAPGTTRVVPKLAVRWQYHDGGRAWTFELRHGVRFHDGARLDARAVCFNFDRWYRFRGVLQSTEASYYWHQVFGGFQDDTSGSGPSLYRECRVLAPLSVELVLTRPFGALPAALALPSFTIGSPEALRRYHADVGRIDSSGIFRARGTYSSEHPTGTGPFRFSSWAAGHQIVLERNPDYWGPTARVDRVVFRPIGNGDDRLAALEQGEIDLVDLYGKADLAAVEGPGVRIVSRPPFDVGYVGMNQELEPFDRPLVRRAVALGLDRAAVADAYYAPGAAVAQEFTPPSLAGYAATAAGFRFDPDRARALLRQAGLTLPVPVELRYPTGISRPYMPDPHAIAQRFASSLERAGFDVVLRAEAWLPDYLRRIRTGAAALYLLGWIGDYADAGAFLDPLFGPGSTGFGLESPSLDGQLEQANAEPNPPARAAHYRRANRTVMRLLPGVPFVTTRQPVGLRRSVRGFVPSPLGIESLAGVSIDG